MASMTEWTEAQQDAVDKAAAWLACARRVLAITGAGMSAESGLPTYRGVGGLYEEADGEDGLPVEVALSGERFAAEPWRTWRHLRQIESACRGARPHAGHHVLAAWQDRFELTVLTQNIDGFHGAAGSRQLIEMHGNMHRLVCTVCAWSQTVDHYGELADDSPCCPDCAAVIRPAVVLFGEMLPTAALEQYDQVMASRPDVVLSIGTTSVFPYIAAPVHWCRQWGGRSIEINPSRTEVSDAVDVCIRAPAAKVLQALDAALTPG